MRIFPVLNLIVCLPAYTHGGCSRHTLLYQRNGSFSSANFPNNYPLNCDERWTLQRINADSQITLTFEFMDIVNQKHCSWDWVEVEYAGGETKFCQDSNKPIPPIISSTDIEVYFHSDDVQTKKGFKAHYVVEDTDECMSEPCQHNASCTDHVNIYTCPCGDGYSEINCGNDTDDCVSDPCQHNGTCTDDVNSYTCKCMDGYSGVNCEHDIDECMSEPCQHNGTDHVNSYTCTCEDGYSGINCENDTDECLSGPCQHNGTCTDHVNSYTCTCMDGYSGVICENDTDECMSEPCQHNGTCTDHVNSYTCTCEDGYSGINCENDTDEGSSSPCQHQGTCIDKINNYECKCKFGYTGDLCEKVITPRHQNKVCQCRACKKVTTNSDVVALKVLRNTTSKYARRLGCAKDDRVSSAVLGVSFPLVIFVVWVILLKLDIETHCLHNKIAPTKTVQRK